jgi:serine/threonine-protein kinase
MDRVYGETLAACLERLGEERMPIAEVLDLLVGISVALSAAHAAGVAHRDLKPSNVILSGERIVLVDLGLFVPEVLVGPNDIPAGSVDSIAPEVILSTVERGGGHFIDLYALGVLAYELLTGAPPYVADTIESILAQHVSAPIPDPKTRRADVPPELAALVHDLLAKDPRDRPQGAEAVLRELEVIRATTARSSRPPRLSNYGLAGDAPRSSAVRFRQA